MFQVYNWCMYDFTVGKVVWCVECVWYKTMILSHMCCLAQIFVVRSVCGHWMFLLDQLDTELIWFVDHSSETHLGKLWHSTAVRWYKMCRVPSAIQPWQGVWIFPHQNTADFVMNSAAEYEDWGDIWRCCEKGKKKVVAHFPRWMCLPNYIHKF